MPECRGARIKQPLTPQHAVSKHGLLRHAPAGDEIAEADGVASSRQGSEAAVAKAKRKQYSDKFRAGIVAMLQSEGYPEQKGALARVSAYCQVPAMTISRWFKQTNNPPPNELVTEKKEELADLFEKAARVYITHAVKDDVVDQVAGQAAMTAAGIAVDKMQLLRGLPTAIISIIPQVVKALEDAGYDPVKVFNDLIAEAATKQQELSTTNAQ